MDLNEWKEKNKYAKGYAHFDSKVPLNKVWNYISNSNNIITHSFYPFIHYNKGLSKFKNGERKDKIREICYASHIDGYIYSYYGYQLNEIYNERVKEDKIDNVAIAYRNNLKKNNINFAKEAIDFIRESKECYIIVGDFTGFFDNLDHAYLKEQICNLLNVEKLPKDFYAVYKNITKYSTWELEEILKYHNLKNTDSGIKKLNHKEKVFTINEYRNLKSKNVNNAKKNLNGYGIPQGSPISAVLSNVYMLDTDKSINTIVKELNGMYMRYSDDVIIILPRLKEEQFKSSLNKIMSIFQETPGLNLQEDKTQLYKYNNGLLVSCNNFRGSNILNGKNELNYLGFTFDGQKVRIRDKTISKYYYRMYRKTKTIVKSKGISKKGKRISPRNLYKRYSIKGIHVKTKSGNRYIEGNFLTYVERCERVWGKNELILRGTKRHLIKIRRQLDKIN